MKTFRAYHLLRLSKRSTRIYDWNTLLEYETNDDKELLRKIHEISDNFGSNPDLKLEHYIVNVDSGKKICVLHGTLGSLGLEV